MLNFARAANAVAPRQRIIPHTSAAAFAVLVKYGLHYSRELSPATNRCRHILGSNRKKHNR